MHQERDRFKHLLIILLEALSANPEDGGSLSGRIQEKAAAAGLDEEDLNGLLDWIESHWEPEQVDGWENEPYPDSPSGGTFRYFGAGDSEYLTGAGLGAKSADRRNFELGVWTHAVPLIDATLAQFNALWEGTCCRGCKRKDICPEPLEEPRL